MTTSNKKRLAMIVAVNLAIGIGLLVVLDLVLIGLDVFPPRYDYGDSEIGWVPAPAPGSAWKRQCLENSTGTLFEYARNDRGVRTAFSSGEILADTTSYKIAVTGDSQTSLCAPNAQTHPGVLAAQLREIGVPAMELAYGSPRYSPLQGYLAFKRELTNYAPHAFVLNFYTGNDFYDMLRVDDRPYLAHDSGGYRIHPPVWYNLRDPNKRHRSRVLYVTHSIFARTGLNGIFFRVRFLSAVAAEQGKGFGTMLSYMNDLRKSRESSVGYREAFAAQILNQQLFFHHFPESRPESLRRVRALLSMVRQENPNMLLVLSALPSYQLATTKARADSSFLATLDRLPLGYEAGVEQERELYDSLRTFAAETGWLFVDNLSALREYDGRSRLYNDFDYHLTVAASAIIGRTQAELFSSSLQIGKTGS